MTPSAAASESGGSPLPETATGVLAEVRALEASIRAAEARKLELAAHWADLHPDPSETRQDRTPAYGQAAVSWLEREDAPDEVEFEHDAFIPAMAWNAGAPFAAALGRSTAAGERFIRDALVLRHRLPATWTRVRAGEVEGWRGRRIASALVGEPADVADALDTLLAPLAHSLGATGLDRRIADVHARLHPEEVELASLEALDATYVELDERSIGHTGVADLHIRGEWADLHNFEATISRVAGILKHRAAVADPHAPAESLGRRRARAVGILADPHQAAALLDDPDHGPTHPRRRVDLVLHLTPDHLDDSRDPFAALGTGPGRAVLTDTVRTWCANPHATIRVRPVIDLTAHDHTDGYAVPTRLATQADLLANGHCTFPWCTRPATRCDHDHAVPYSDGDPPGGRTCSCNLHPLCRRHHRLKTHAGWRVRPLEPGVWHWTDPFGHHYRRDPDGTTELTPPTTIVEAPDQDALRTGCHRLADVAAPIGKPFTGAVPRDNGPARPKPSRPALTAPPAPIPLRPLGHPPPWAIPTNTLRSRPEPALRPVG